METEEKHVPERRNDKQEEIVLFTGGIPRQEFAKNYSYALNSVLMLVFANSQIELDLDEMKAIRDVMDLSIRFQNIQEESA